MFAKLRFVLFFLFVVLFVSFSISAQSESDDWYLDKPITKIRFKGLQSVKQSEVSGLVSSYIGKNVGDCFYDIVNRLEALDYFEEIEPSATHDSGNGVILVITVKEKPVISAIKFQGNRKLRNPTLREALSIKVGNVFIESEVFMEDRAIRNVYLNQGYTAAKVSHKTKETEDGIEIVFDIFEGDMTAVSDIKFVGNTIFSSKKLKKQTKMKTSNILKKNMFKESQLEQDKQALTKFYMDRGYIDFDIIDVTRDVVRNEKKNRDELTITYYVYEGYVYTFDSLTFTGNKVFSTERLNKFILLKNGDIFNATKFAQSIMSVSDLYYENGYTQNSFQPVENHDAEGHKVSCVLNIVERDRSHVEKVIVKGNTKTKDYVITRELPIESGDVFSKAKISNGLRNLNNLRFFSSVVPTVEPGSDSDLVNLVVSVEEQRTNSIEFGVTFSSASNPGSLPFSLMVQWSNANFLGLGKTVSAGVNLSSTVQSVNLGYQQDWLWDMPITWSESISFSHSKANTYRLGIDYMNRALYETYYMEYERWTLSAEHSLGHRWMPNWAILSITGGLTNSLSNFVYDDSVYVPLDPTISRYANTWGLTNSIWVKWAMDGRDFNFDPARGWFFSERVGWYGILPIEVDYFMKSETKLEGYRTLINIPFGEKWSFRLVFAALTNFSFEIPTSVSQVSENNKLYIDGMFNGRGWTDIYNKVRGQVMWSNNLELRFPVIPGVLAFDGFFDAVVIKDNLKDFFSDTTIPDFYFSFGPDARILMPQFPLRLIFANCFRIVNGEVEWGDTLKFVLSFNVVNK